MSQFWKEYNVFISSTFRDMDAERDAIKQFVIPRLNKHYRHLRVSFHAIDLRFGVNTQNLREEESENMVLGTCFSKIDSSRPFFIGLLGERYGWIPNKDRVDFVISALSEQKRHLFHNDGLQSVTELELLYGTIGEDGERLAHSLFFFRDKESYLNIPDNIRADFEDICNNALSPEERTFLADKQNQLKSKIKEICRINQVEDKCINYHLEWDNSSNSYADMSDFINMVYERLCCEIDKEIRSIKTDISWYDVEKETSLYLLHKSERCCINEKIINAIVSDLQYNSRIAIVANDGFGKTTLTYQLYKRLISEPNTLVLMINPEISPYTKVLENTLFYWVLQMQDFLGIENGIDDIVLGKRNAYEVLYEKFYTLINRVKKEGYTIVAIIDGIESLQTGKDLLWLNDSIPSVVTAKNHVPGCHSINLDCEAIDAENILKTQEFRHDISLPCQVRENILLGNTKPIDIALFSSMFSNLAFKDFSQIRRLESGTEIEKINNYITSVYEDAQIYTGSLFIYALNFLLERMEAVHIREAVEYIAISEEGLRLSDLAVLLGDKWCEMKFLVLMELMGDFFMENPLTKQWKLKYSHLRKELQSFTNHIQKVRELLHLIEQYEDDDPIKKSMLLALSLSSQNVEVIKKYFIFAYVDDKNGNIWVTNISLALMMQSDSWLECLRGVISKTNSEEKVCFVFSLCNILILMRNYGVVKTLVSLLDDVDVSCLSPEGCYTLAYLYREVYLLHKYDNNPYNDISSKLLERIINCHEACRIIVPDFRDNNILYMAILAEYASDLSMKGEYEKADEIFEKMLIN